MGKFDKKRLTAENGRPIADNQNTQTAGVRGVVTMQDPWLIEKLAHFDREVIPERRMHAKGSGAYGAFTVTDDITEFTRASIFSQVGKVTPCFVRFSTVAGERGAADAERDIRGFAIKFYTDTGNWDLVGNNTPVFFLRDPLKFPDLNHAIKRDPRTGMRNANSNWDFWTLLPEALHQVTITMSPRGIPASFRHMHGFGSHTYSFYNADNERTWVKFHLRTLQGIKNLTDAEAEAVVAAAKKKAEELDANTRSEIKLYGAQAVGALKSEIATMVTDTIVKAAVKEALAGDSVKAMLVKIAERWSADEALVISTAEADALKAYFAKNAKALLDKGVEIKQVNGLKTLFSIAPADGSYKVNFGEGEFEAFFKSFLRPQMVELLF
mgnify:CR=1 FL=1